MEIELLDADGRPRAPRSGEGRVPGSRDRRRSPTLVAAAVGVAAAWTVLVVGGLVADEVRSRAADDLDGRVTAASAAGATAVADSGVLAAADPVIALQVLQSPGVVVESTGPPADRAMVAQAPRPATTELSTFTVTDGSSARRYRVAATTLPTQAGVAGRTVVAAALPLGGVEGAERPVRAAASAAAATAGLGAALTTRRVLRRRAIAG